MDLKRPLSPSLGVEPEMRFSVTVQAGTTKAEPLPHEGGLWLLAGAGPGDEGLTQLYDHSIQVPPVRSLGTPPL